MPSKNISITKEVYDVLVKMRHGNESFSEIIKRLANEQKLDPLRFFGILKDESKENIDIVEDSIEKVRTVGKSLSNKSIEENWD